MPIDGNVQPPCARQYSSMYAGRPTSVGLKREVPRNLSIWSKRLVDTWVSSSVVPITFVQLPAYDHWYRERSAEWIRRSGSGDRYVQSLTYSRNVTPLPRKKMRSLGVGLKSIRPPNWWLTGESGSPPR